MFGQDFQKIGSENYVKARVGDGDGDPFVGPIKINYLSKGELLIISSANNYFKIPTIAAYKFMINKVDRFYVHSDMNRGIDKDPNDPDNHYFDLVPTALCVTQNSNDSIIAVTDKSHTVQFISSTHHNLVHCYGQLGSGPGEFSEPTSIDQFTTESGRVIYCVLERGGNQRLHFFDENFKHILFYGSMGHAEGQFFDATSVACHSVIKKTRMDNNPPDYYVGICSLEELVLHAFAASHCHSPLTPCC